MLSISDRFRFQGHIFLLVRRKRIELRPRLTNGHPCRQPGRSESNPCVPFNEFRVNGDVLGSSVDYGRLRLCLKPWRAEPCPLSGQKPVVSTVGCAPWQEVTPTATTSTLRWPCAGSRPRSKSKACCGRQRRLNSVTRQPWASNWLNRETVYANGNLTKREQRTQGRKSCKVPAASASTNTWGFTFVVSSVQSVMPVCGYQGRDSPVQTGVHEDVVFPISVCDKWPNLFMREVSPREGARGHGLGSTLPELVRISLLAAHVHQWREKLHVLDRGKIRVLLVWSKGCFVTEWHLHNCCDELPRFLLECGCVPPQQVFSSDNDWNLWLMPFGFKRTEIVCSRVNARSCFSGCDSGQNMLGGRRSSIERSGIGCLLKEDRWRTAISTRRSVTNDNIDKKVGDERQDRRGEREERRCRGGERHEPLINEERGVDSLIIEEYKIDEEIATNNKLDEESITNDKIHEAWTTPLLWKHTWWKGAIKFHKEKQQIFDITVCTEEGDKRVASISRTLKMKSRRIWRRRAFLFWVG